MSDEVAVGDLNSNEVGSGARKNAGKDPLEYIPVMHWLMLWRHELSPDLVLMMEALAEWQEGNDAAIHTTLIAMGQHWDESVKAFDFGAKKYAKWNWAKGMEYSVPVGCILRHTRSIVRGEVIDEDSGATHKGCIVCNLHMLAWYTGRYPELDDRPIFTAPTHDPVAQELEFDNEYDEYMAVRRGETT